MLKGAGVLATGLATTYLGFKLYAATSLSPNAQDGALAVQGLVLGGVAKYYRQDALAASLLVAPWSGMMIRRMLVGRVLEENERRTNDLPPIATALPLPPSTPAGYPVPSNAYFGNGVSVG